MPRIMIGEQPFDVPQEVADLLDGFREAQEDKRRLAREIDVAMHGAGAAQQASLCDLVHPARELAEALAAAGAAVGLQPGIAQRPRDVAVEVQKRFAEACERVYDLLLGDDGEAYFEAEKFLKRVRPDLYNRIGMEGQADLFTEH